MSKKLPLLFLFGCLLYNNGNAQSSGSESPALNPNPGAGNTASKKGSFFITPFYEFTSFKKLELISNTNHYKLWDGESSYELTDDQVKQYNDNFGTEYQNHMVGLKVGYQVMEGFGISGYAGINQFDFKSFVSDENTQTLGSDKPAFTLGVAVDYQKALGDKFAAMSMLSYNYCTTGSVTVDNNSGLDVVSSSLKSMYWEINLALAYRYKKLVPYAGVGFTQQFVNSVHQEKIPTTNDLGEDVYNLTEFDSHFRGSAVYGFAGLKYNFSKKLSVYGRSSFMSPLRANVGVHISL
jgi:hypothetical protein